MKCPGLQEARSTSALRDAQFSSKKIAFFSRIFCRIDAWDVEDVFFRRGVWKGIISRPIRRGSDASVGRQ